MSTEDTSQSFGDVIIPNDPKIHKRIKDCILEVHNSQERVSGERSFQKNAIKDLADETQIPKSFLRKLSSWNKREGGRDAAISEIESLDVAYTQVFGPSVSVTTPVAP